MATIMFLPFPEFGHVNPTLKLARELKQSGNRVCYVGLADFDEYVRSQGLEFIPILESSYPKGSSGERSARMKLGRVELIMIESREADDEIISKPLERVKKEFGAIIRETAPDLLIVDFLIGGLAYMAVREFGITSAVFSVTLLEGWMIGEPPDDPQHLQLPMLILCPEEFDFHGAERKPNRHYIEASIDLQRKELHPFPWRNLNASRPLIYCSLGSESHLYEQSSSLFRAIIEAMRAKPEWQLVLAVGPYLNASDFEPLPENVLLVNWAPQLDMLKRASIMITHGGLGAVKECICLGVPMIVFPFKWDQPFNAARAVAHGLGVRGNVNNVSAREIHSLIDAIVGNPLLKSRIDAMSKKFNEIENSGRGVKLIEKIITDCRDSRNGAARSARPGASGFNTMTTIEKNREAFSLAGTARTDTWAKTEG